MPPLRERFSGLMEFRTAIRALRRRPAYVAAALITFTLGTGATTTVFTVVDAVLIKPLPYRAADRLVTVYEANASDRTRTILIAPARLADWDRLNQSFEIISGFYGESVTDTSGGDPERLAGRRVAPAFFSVFGVDALRGRTFAAEEELYGGPRSAVLSEQYWRRRYAGDPGVLGRSLVIGNANYTIVGVMPATFAQGPTDVWLPAQFAPGLLQARNARFLNGIARLKAGVSVEQAEADLDRVQRDLAGQFPKTDVGWSAAVADLKGSRVGEHRARLWVVFGAVALLWAIAITNICALVLVDARRRSRELAMRRALGASRARIVSLVVLEVLVMALTGAVLGTVMAAWALQYVKATFVLLPRIAELALDWRVFLFAAVTNTAAAVACGVIPALGATRSAELQEVSRGTRTVSGSHRLQRSLVVAQVALSVVLCASALLLARSYVNLLRADLGFSTEGVVAFHVAARWDEDRTRIGQLQEAVVGAVERLPGVEAVGLTSSLPIGGAPWRREATVDGLSLSEPTSTLTTGQRTIGAAYLQAIRVPRIAGEWCGPFRPSTAPESALVNEALANQFADKTSLIGQRLRLTETGWTYTIVGVVGNVAEDGPAVAPSPYMYVCGRPGNWPDPEYVVRAKNPASLMTSLRASIREIDATRAVFSVRPLSDAVTAAIEQPRIGTSLIAAFAAAAMLLAATGLYGLFALVVAETRREMGVRLALGATPRQLARFVCTRAGRLLVVGLLIGFGLTAGAGRWLQSLLFGIGAFDALALTATILTVILVSAIAVAIPAFRAARVLPAEALRSE